MNPDIVIVDLKVDKANNVIENFKLYSNARFLPIIFINAPSDKNIFYYDEFPFSRVVSFDVDDKYVLEKIIKNINILSMLDTRYNKMIKVTADKKDLRIFANDILYIESSNNKTILYCKNSVIYSKDIKISKCKEQLGDQFCICHRKYAVNKNHISSINFSEKKIYLYNNEKYVSIGRVYKDSFINEIQIL